MDSNDASPCSSKAPLQTRKPSINDDKDTKEINIKIEAGDLSSMSAKKDSSVGAPTTKKNSEDPTKRAVISQEETDQAVTALLGESFESSFESCQVS